MENIVDNHVRIYAINEDVLNKAILVINSKMNYAPLYGTTTEVSFDKDTQLFIYKKSFCTCWSPPVEVYEVLNAIEGITVDAIWFDEWNHFNYCYHWPGEGYSYEPLESTLNEQGVEVWSIH